MAKKTKGAQSALGGVIVRFQAVSFEYGHNHPILDEVDFSLRKGTRVTLMGQNGAGKSTIFKIITGELEQESGVVHRVRGVSIAVAPQVIPRAQFKNTVREFFEACFSEKVYDIDPKIDKVLGVVNLNAPYDRTIESFSGSQQARLLLASAIIQDPDLLLLDEPTNNLDKAGIEQLTDFLRNYKKSCLVISHDADFLNSFTDGVLYLDVYTRNVEQYVGNYYDLLKEITARIERENQKNALLAKKIKSNKEKANFFAQKGGKMRLVAKRMRNEVKEMEENKVSVRKEDKTIRPFTIPAQSGIVGELLTINFFTTMDTKKYKLKKHKKNIVLKKRRHLLLQGPNGIGKTTLLESFANGTAEGATVAEGIRVGYYRQIFSMLDFEQTVYESLLSAMAKPNEEKMRAMASGFLITAEQIHKRIDVLSEGQKGLVAFARLVLEKPGLLVLDEPTNHINFRHLPVIAKALDEYEGAMVLVSHVPEFVEQVRIDEVLDLGK